MGKSTVKLDLSGLEKIKKKLKKYEEPTHVSLPYTEEQWNKMTEYEKQQVKEQVINEYKDSIIKDLNGK